MNLILTPDSELKSLRGTGCKWLTLLCGCITQFKGNLPNAACLKLAPVTTEHKHIEWVGNYKDTTTTTGKICNKSKQVNYLGIGFLPQRFLSNTWSTEQEHEYIILIKTYFWLEVWAVLTECNLHWHILKNVSAIVN